MTPWFPAENSLWRKRVRGGGGKKPAQLSPVCGWAWQRSLNIHVPYATVQSSRGGSGRTMASPVPGGLGGRLWWFSMSGGRRLEPACSGTLRKAAATKARPGYVCGISGYPTRIHVALTGGAPSALSASASSGPHLAISNSFSNSSF